MKKNKNKYILQAIFWFLVLLAILYIRVSHSAQLGKGISPVGAVYSFLIILLFFVYMYTSKKLKRDYYTPRGLSLSSRIYPVLFSPKDCFKKERLWSGYLIYLISKICLIAAIYLLILLGGELR